MAGRREKYKEQNFISFFTFKQVFLAKVNTTTNLYNFLLEKKASNLALFLIIIDFPFFLFNNTINTFYFWEIAKFINKIKYKYRKKYNFQETTNL